MVKDPNITKLITKFYDGDSITDSELAVLLEYFEDLYAKAQHLPVEFSLFRKEINRVFFQLEGYSNTRKRK